MQTWVPFPRGKNKTQTTVIRHQCQRPLKRSPFSMASVIHKLWEHWLPNVPYNKTGKEIMFSTWEPYHHITTHYQLYTVQKYEPYFLQDYKNNTDPRMQSPVQLSSYFLCWFSLVVENLSFSSLDRDIVSITSVKSSIVGRSKLWRQFCRLPHHQETVS